MAVLPADRDLQHEMQDRPSRIVTGTSMRRITAGVTSSISTLRRAISAMRDVT